VTVPAQWAMSAQLALDDPEIGPILSNYSDKGKIVDRTPLAIYLLFQRNKGQASPWASYISTTSNQLLTC